MHITLLVREIMVETFTSRIKLSNFAEIFVLGYLLRKNMAPRKIQTLTLAVVIKRGRRGVDYSNICNFLLSK